MARDKIYTRAYSKRSAGKLVSGKGPMGNILSHTELLNEFRNHVIKNKKDSQPTALVSVSDRIVDTIKRGFEMHANCEPLADIRIAFIEAPAATCNTLTHRAQELAHECGISNPNQFHHEIVFEWAIPEVSVLHEVSLQTLVDRGLDWRNHLASGDPDHPLVSTKKLRARVAVNLRPQDSYWEIGLHLGLFAKMFGARAPVNWIAYQLFHDCVRTNIIDGDVTGLSFTDGHFQMVESNFASEFDEGIETALIDWWLADTDFFLDYKEFEEWRDAIEDCMAWDLIDYWETWVDDDCDTGLEQFLCGQAWTNYQLSTKGLEQKSKQEPYR